MTEALFNERWIPIMGKKSMRVKELQPETGLTVLNEVPLIRNVMLFDLMFFVTWYLVSHRRSWTGLHFFLFYFH
jgi:hypothetical protein